jgi:hypothetical protein
MISLNMAAIHDESDHGCLLTGYQSTVQNFLSSS